MVKTTKKARKILKETVAVVGIGRVGLPLALFLADRGHQVWVIDVDQSKVTLIASGKMPFMEEGALALLKKNLGKTFTPSTDYSNIARAKTIILTLGTP